MGAVLRICPSRQPASRARVASRINEPRSPSAVMRQVLFEDEDSQAIVVPSGDESTEAERSGSSSQSRQVDADSKVKKARRRRGEVLEDMDAWHCAQSIGEAAGCLSSASASVTKLALRGVPLTDEDVARLATLLGENVNDRAIVSASAATCRCPGNLGDQGAEHLAEALAENEVLTSLSLEGNRVGDRGAARLAAALERNEALTCLSLGRNCVGGQGVKHLLDALESNYTLLTLDLASNSGSHRPSWSSAGDSRAAIQKRLQALLKRNRGPRKVVTLHAEVKRSRSSEASQTGQHADSSRTDERSPPMLAANATPEMLWISCTSMAGTLLTELSFDGALSVKDLREELAKRLALPKPHLALLSTDGKLLQAHDPRSLRSIFLETGGHAKPEVFDGS
ncbi:unnamed protein product [Durusdinium trenchii]|uniref:Uncharacterized protein n=1 Tax=Durusdinium trenchii TaxID=1381693 RepID=A0ABP0SXA9_9DINO